MRYQQAEGEENTLLQNTGLFMADLIRTKLSEIAYLKVELHVKQFAYPSTFVCVWWRCRTVKMKSSPTWSGLVQSAQISWGQVKADHVQPVLTNLNWLN